jgi:hypothetical protein
VFPFPIDLMRRGFWGRRQTLPRQLNEMPANANVAASIRRLVVPLALILVAIGLAHSPTLADDASALIGRWLVPSRAQEKSRMSPQCQQYAETDVQRFQRAR